MTFAVRCVALVASFILAASGPAAAQAASLTPRPAAGRRRLDAGGKPVTVSTAAHAEIGLAVIEAAMANRDRLGSQP